MTAADHSPADPTVGQRSRTGDPPTPPQVLEEDGRPGLLNQIMENPLLSLFGAVIVVLLGSLLTTSNIRISETNERLASLETRLDTRIDRLEDRLDSLDGRIDSLNSRIDSLDGRIDRLDSRIDSLNSRIDSLNSRIDSLDSRVGSLEGTVAGIDRKLTALIAALGKTDEVEAALSAGAGAIRTGQPLDEAEER